MNSYNTSLLNSGSWQLAPTHRFWEDIACNDHIVQFYKDENTFIEMLAAFVGAGINAGDSVVVIATAEHRQMLEERLKDHVISIETLVNSEQYIALDSSATLSKFMKDGMPDANLFKETVSTVYNRAKMRGRKVRAFGEMVAKLWTDGNREGTILLENLWNDFSMENELTLFCAYPENIFEGEATEWIGQICCCHNKMISDTEKPLTELVYTPVPLKSIA